MGKIVEKSGGINGFGAKEGTGDKVVADGINGAVVVIQRR